MPSLPIHRDKGLVPLLQEQNTRRTYPELRLLFKFMDVEKRLTGFRRIPKAFKKYLLSVP
jgi:hypothetical protein